MSDKGVKFVIGIYDDEDILLDAISSVRGKGVNIHEVYSPFPVHGIEDRLGYKRSRLSIAAFCFGFLGTCLALTMMIGMMTIDWPMIIGGKDFLPLPVFIPVTFDNQTFREVNSNYISSTVPFGNIAESAAVALSHSKHVFGTRRPSCAPLLNLRPTALPGHLDRSAPCDPLDG